MSDHKGFDINGNTVTDTGTSKAALLLSPSGLAISLSQHLKSGEAVE